LVGGGKRFLETGISITEFVTPSLFRLDALLSDGFATPMTEYRSRTWKYIHRYKDLRIRVSLRARRRRRLKLVIVVFLCVHGDSLLGNFAVPPASAKSGAIGRNTYGVEAMRPGNSRGIRNSRTRAAVTGMPTRGRSLGGRIAVAEIVGKSRCRHAIALRRSVRALGRRCIELRRVSVIT